MEPRRIKKAGRELGNAAAAAALCIDPKTGRPITAESFQWYVARTERLIAKGKRVTNPAPKHVEVDNQTEQRMYPLKEVRAWHAARRGRGNWGGAGARARVTPSVGIPTDKRPGASTVCNYCARTVLVVAGLMERHGTSDTEQTRPCMGTGERAPVRPDAPAVEDTVEAV